LMEQQSKTLAGMISTTKDLAGQMLAGWLTPLFPALKAGLGALNDMSSGTKTTIAVIAGSIGVFGLAAKSALGLSSAFRALGASATAARVATGGVGAALALATAGFALYASEHAKGKARVEDFTQALQGETDALNKNVRTVAAKQLQDAGALGAAQTLGLGLSEVTDAALGQGDALARIQPLLDGYVAQGVNGSIADQDRASAAGKLSDAIKGVGGSYNKAVGESKQMQAATESSATAMGGMEKKTKDAKEELQRWRTEMMKSARAALDLEGSQDAVEAAVDDATQSVKDNGKTLDKNTEKGRNNRQALRNLASSSLAYREKLIEQGASQKRVTNATMDAREAFIKTATKMGATKKEAERLADKYGLLDTKINDLNDKTVKTEIKWRTNVDGYKTSFVGEYFGKRRAQGGPITGPGTGTSDSILGIDRNSGGPTAWVSNGEYVVNARSARKHRGLIEDINADRLAVGGVVKPKIFSSEFPDVTGASAAQRRYASRELTKYAASYMEKRLDEAIGQNMGAGLPGGGRPIGKGQAALIRYGRMLGMGASTYPGHHPSMSRARDFSPVSSGRGDAMAGHAWAHARNYGVWYVIWNRRIASRTRPGAGWRPYTRYGSSGSPSQMHTNHVHVAWYDKGGVLPRGGVAFNGGSGPERVLSAQQTRSFDRLVSSMERHGGAGVTYIINAPHYVGDKNDLVKALVDLDRQNRLSVVKR
jgi:hypothetical protein